MTEGHLLHLAASLLEAQRILGTAERRGVLPKEFMDTSTTSSLEAEILDRARTGLSWGDIERDIRFSLVHIF